MRVLGGFWPLSGKDLLNHEDIDVHEGHLRQVRAQERDLSLLAVR